MTVLCQKWGKYSILASLKGKGEACIEISTMKFSPVEIASVIFAKPKDTILMYQFHHEWKAVISVPIFFNKQQREDIVLAGNKTGLTVLQLIDEPRQLLFPKQQWKNVPWLFFTWVLFKNVSSTGSTPILTEHVDLKGKHNERMYTSQLHRSIERIVKGGSNLHVWDVHSRRRTDSYFQSCA